GHASHSAGPTARAVAQTIPMLERPLEHVADDLHVAMAVSREPTAGLHAVLVQDAEGAAPHLGGVLGLPERERGEGAEPREVKMPARFAAAQRDHGSAPRASRILRSRSSSGSTYFCRQ